MSLEQNLQRELMASVMEIAIEAVVAADAAQRIVLFNQGAEYMFGLSAEEAIGQPLNILIPERFRQMHDTYLDHFMALSDGMSRHMKERGSVFGLRADGEEFPAEVSITKLEINGETFIASIMQDISIRKNNEASLRDAVAVFEGSNEAIMIMDGQGLVSNVNRAFSEISGYSKEEVLGRNSEFMRSGQQSERFYRKMFVTARKQGSWSGEVWNRRKNGEPYLSFLNVSAIRDEKGTLSRYMASFSDITALRESEEKLSYQVHHDLLTGLPNRDLINDRLQHAVDRAARSGKQVSVLIIDLKRFKSVNDSLGYMAGDGLLQQAAERMKELLREGDTIGRLVGDEFVIILEGLSEAQHAGVLAEKIIDAFHSPFTIEGHEVYSGVSIGISVYIEGEADMGRLIANADIAISKIRSGSESAYHFYTEELTELAVERSRLESRLRQALEDQQFQVYYQPQFCLSSGRMTGAEALVRWIHPQDGFIGPDKFIPLAEACGLILPIGEWVLRESCRQVMAWRQDGLNLDRIGVNIAGAQIQRGNLTLLVKQILAESGLDAATLELEITEGFVMDKPAEAIALMHELRDLGLELAIDDFGTGHSSLSYLKQFPVHTLKIDQSFIREMAQGSDNEAIVRAIISLAHSIGMKVIAEGVELDEQRQFLADEGCEEGQGYHFSRPLPSDEFEALLIKQKV